MMHVNNDLFFAGLLGRYNFLCQFYLEKKIHHAFVALRGNFVT
jgi:hypothetical protein